MIDRQGEFEQHLSNIDKEASIDLRLAKANTFWTEIHEKFTTVGDESGYIADKDGFVTFLWKGNPKSSAIYLSSELSDYFHDFELKNIAGTDLYYLTSDKPLPNDLRTGYVLDYNFDHYEEKIKTLQMVGAPAQKYVPNQESISIKEKEFLMRLKPTLVDKQLTDIKDEKNHLKEKKLKLTDRKIKLAKEHFENTDFKQTQSITKEISSIEDEIKVIESWEKRLDKRCIEINNNKKKFPTSSTEIGELELVKMKADMRFIELTLPPESKFSGKRVWVHLPENFKDNHDKPYPLLLLLDGLRQHTIMPIPSVLDNMTKENVINPTVTIYLEEGSGDGLGSDRFNQYDCNNEFTEFLADKDNGLIPIVTKLLKDEHSISLKLTSNPKSATIGGFSMSGLAAIYAGLKHPEVFGNVIAQSPSLWKQDEYGSQTINNFDKVLRSFDANHELNIFQNVGNLENNKMRNQFPPGMIDPRNGFCRSMLEANNDFHRTKIPGVTVIRGMPYNGGHNYCCWQGLIFEPLMQIYKPANKLTEEKAKTSSSGAKFSAMKTQTQFSSTTLTAQGLNIPYSSLSIPVQNQENGDKRAEKKRDDSKREDSINQILPKSSTIETHKVTPFITVPKPGKK